MKIILGIGNVGDIYTDTRHNSGFQAVETLASDFGLSFRLEKAFQAFVAKGKILDDDVILMKPTTFVNLSGVALKSVMLYFKADVSDIYVLVDDMDLEPGHIKMKLKGSAGGHNGLKSIIAYLGTENFKRIRIGIGKPVGNDCDFVLSAPKDKQVYKTWKDGISKAAEAMEYTIKCQSFEKAMTVYNQK
jgi:PTH1 family peptidyl-tRNA hydrolase